MHGVYLLHFTRPLHHAQHYIGWSWTIDARCRAHRRGEGCHLTRAAVRAGIRLYRVRVWPNADRAFERYLKVHYKNARALCPRCCRRAKRTPRNPQRPEFPMVAAPVTLPAACDEEVSWPL